MNEVKIVDEKKLKDHGLKGIPFARFGGKIPKTGDWRTFKPVINKKKCIKCHTCWLLCPEAAIKIDKKGYPKIDYHVCKGCLICFKNCPVRAIEKKEDLHAEHLR